MSLFITGGFVLRNLVKPCFVVPSSVNQQVRHAARKGYRAQAEKKKQMRKIEKVVSKEFTFRKKAERVELTVPTGKPEPPNDDIIIRDNFNYKRYSISEATSFHREYHHPTVYNNPEAPVNVKIELNLRGKSQNQLVRPFNGVVAIPHKFLHKRKREVLVLCQPDNEEPALNWGASLAGGTALIKKIKSGAVQPGLYDYIICQSIMLPEIAPIRGLLKDKLPRTKNGTVTDDLKTAIDKFLTGIEYKCTNQHAPESGIILCSIGTINMELEHLEENFVCLLKDILLNKPDREGDFITWTWCLSPPSDEQFCIGIEEYLKTLGASEPQEEVAQPEKKANRK